MIDFDFVSTNEFHNIWSFPKYCSIFDSGTYAHNDELLSYNGLNLNCLFSIINAQLLWCLSVFPIRKSNTKYGKKSSKRSNISITFLIISNEYLSPVFASFNLSISKLLYNILIQYIPSINAIPSCSTIL